MWISRIKEDARTALQGYSISSGLFILLYFLVVVIPPTIIDIVCLEDLRTGPIRRILRHFLI
ncbi:MAG: hypothetical protein K0S24_5049 [Sphingobacterium sp.]|jgi:hypothetical protein|nr:hypothetical protein [Sphingobacterium sp.]